MGQEPERLRIAGQVAVGEQAGEQTVAQAAPARRLLGLGLVGQEIDASRHDRGG